MRAFLAAVLAVFLFGCSVPDKDLRSVTVKVSVDGGHGTGVLVSPNLILTAGHVGEEIGRKVMIEFFDGKKVPGIVTYVSPTGEDHALIALLHPVKIQPATLSCEIPSFDERLTIIGFPLSAEWAVTRGKKANDFFRRDQKNDYWMVDATIYMGNSGGPVFDSLGRVVGIVSAMPAAMSFMGLLTVPIGLVVKPNVLCRSLGAYL